MQTPVTAELSGSCRNLPCCAARTKSRCTNCYDTSPCDLFHPAPHTGTVELVSARKDLVGQCAGALVCCRVSTNRRQEPSGLTGPWTILHALGGSKWAHRSHRLLPS